MKKKDLKLLKETLEIAFSGNGTILPEDQAHRIHKCLNLVKYEIKLKKARAKSEPKRTYDPVEGKTIIEYRDGSTTTFYDDDDLQ